jgi:hypothetical protein
MLSRMFVISALSRAAAARRRGGRHTVGGDLRAGRERRPEAELLDVERCRQHVARRQIGNVRERGRDGSGGRCGERSEN